MALHCVDQDNNFWIKAIRQYVHLGDVKTDDNNLGAGGKRKIGIVWATRSSHVRELLAAPSVETPDKLQLAGSLLSSKLLHDSQV